MVNDAHESQWRQNPNHLSNPFPLPAWNYFLKTSNHFLKLIFFFFKCQTSSKVTKKTKCTYPVCIIVQNDKVSVAHVESWQMITSIFGIKDVFIDYIGCSSRFWSVSTEEQMLTSINIKLDEQDSINIQHCLRQNIVLSTTQLHWCELVQLHNHHLSSDHQFNFLCLRSRIHVWAHHANQLWEITELTQPQDLS